MAVPRLDQPPGPAFCCAKLELFFTSSSPPDEETILMQNAISYLCMKGNEVYDRLFNITNASSISEFRSIANPQVESGTSSQKGSENSTRIQLDALLSSETQRSTSTNSSAPNQVAEPTRCFSARDFIPLYREIANPSFFFTIGKTTHGLEDPIECFVGDVRKGNVRVKPAVFPLSKFWPGLELECTGSTWQWEYAPSDFISRRFVLFVAELFLLSEAHGTTSLIKSAPALHTELLWQLIVTTSSLKKRKISPKSLSTHVAHINHSPDDPLASIEGHCDCNSPADLPRFDLPSIDGGQTSAGLPPPISARVQSSVGLSAQDYASSAASSPSAAYAGLTLESEKVGAHPVGDHRSVRRDTGSHSPAHRSVHRAIMGGAAELPQRSSSPLKRRASELDMDTLEAKESKMAAVLGGGELATDASESSADQENQSVDMVEGEVDMVATSNSNLVQGTVGSRRHGKNKTPTIDAQITTVTSFIRNFLNNPIQPGDEVYIVSKKWLARVHLRSTEAIQHSKVELEGDIGPVDNSDITKQVIKDCDGNDFVQLRPGLGSESFELFPPEAWQMILEWHGLMGGSIPIKRYAYNTNSDVGGIPNVQFEYHPPVFVLHRLWSESTNNIPQGLRDSHTPAPIIVASRSDNFNEFLKRIKKQAGIDLARKVRVWRVPRTLPAGESAAPIISAATTPPPSRPSSPIPAVVVDKREHQLQDSWKDLLLDVPSFLQLERDSQREKIETDDTANSKYNGRSNLQFYGLGDDMALVLDELITRYDYVSNYVGKKQIRAAVPNAISGLNSGLNKATSQANSRRSSPAPGPMTRGRAQRANGRAPGQVGLSNLGNTCYMNSALQCVRSVEELTKYFLSGAARNEVNTDNPLGNGGEVALAYEALLAEIYKEPPPSSVSPRHFKSILGRYAPAFSGYGQQDSQEFLGFLLDGLQEDLSRVKKKPYIEKPDSTDEMIGNHEAIKEMAAKVWDITKQRDDSVVADLFTGMYKSTLVCPVCQKVSITFDPFNNLTLQLPTETPWQHQVYYFPLNEPPVTINVDLDKTASILAMKEFISQRVGVPVERLFAAEEFKGKFFKIYKDIEQASEAITPNDFACVYELEARPTNWLPVKQSTKRKEKKTLYRTNHDSDEELPPHWDDPMAENMIVSVIHRRPNTDKSRYDRKTRVITPVPHFIMLTPEEARNEDRIKRKILEKIATFTTHTIFEEDNDDEPASLNGSMDPDVVLTTGSDADSSGDTKIIAHSIDSEDELVDITTSEAKTKVATRSEPQRIQPLKVFSHRRPKFLEPGSYLEPKLQNMFQLSYFGDPKEIMPSGWHAIDEDKDYPLLSSRSSQPYQDADEVSPVEFDMPNGQSESSDEDVRSRRSFQPATRMNDESSDDDLPQPYKSFPPQDSRARNGSMMNRMNCKTYGKHKSSSRKLSHQLDGANEESFDDGPLIRLGEGIVVDWVGGAWEEMFDGEWSHGSSTFAHISPLEDPDLDRKRKARSLRRKNGITLDDCLNEFGKEEILSDMDTWYCPRCKEHRRASKKFELWKSPDILIMHLKRFSSSQSRRDKVDIYVDFPIIGLDLSSRVVETEDGKQEIYDLFAVDDHWGGLGGGHYTAYAKNWVDDEWYEYNDSAVTKQRDPSRVVSSSAYLLFYRRRSDVPLGGPKFKQISDNFDLHRAQDGVDSGEDQSLGVDSSHRGSPRALTGEEVAHHQDPGSDLGGETVVNPKDIEGLPAYQEHERQDDSAPIFARDSQMNDGLHDSIEEDEGIDMGPTYPSFISHGTGFGTTWNFSAINQLPPRTVPDRDGDLDDRSDIAAHDSSADAESLSVRMREFETSVAESEQGEFVDQSPEPDMDEDAQMSNVAFAKDLKSHVLASRIINSEFAVPAEHAGDEIEEPAAEIHVEEGEGLKMD